ncbi:hypothetical protein [Leptolyngbya sp. FACHB-261]|uniref:hypothetical protein n=1 Tax=Leptolyngbya sp. FACHB-261 TaxID=2692806 RepID=UPI0016835FBB|nr:hypothetical protein [Leptolyngbya sp. FACHB-261]MBD2101430.1 hypothetical protein [Leptolyngbya sp. FACHB-261]
MTSSKTGNVTSRFSAQVDRIRRYFGGSTKSKRQRFVFERTPFWSECAEDFTVGVSWGCCFKERSSERY